MSTALGLDGEWDVPPTPLTIHCRRLRLSVPPASLTPLIGRDGDVAVTCDLLSRNDARLITLVGPGGIGKTRLALQVAADCAAAFDGQVAWAPVATATTPDAVAAGLARAVGMAETGVSPTIDALKTAMRDAHLFLVVDNFEQVLDATPLLSDLLLACPGLAILVTSRAVLRITGERAIEVAPLATVPERDQPSGMIESGPAVRLFAQGAAAVSPAFAVTPESAPVVAEICRRLDGLPLAIELAAARINHLSLNALLDRLDSRLALLTTSARDVPDRHRTMLDAIAWSYDLLTAEQQALFRRLAVFAGGFTLEALDATADDGQDVLTELGALVDNSLVWLEPPHPSGARYTVLETVREFAAIQLAACGEEAAVRERHARCVIAFALANEVAHNLLVREPQLSRLETEWANIQAALSWFSAENQALDLLRLTTSLYLFTFLRGHIATAMLWLDRALALAVDAPDQLRGQGLAALAFLATRLGPDETNRRRAAEAVTLLRPVASPSDLHIALMVSIADALVSGDAAAAEAYANEALTLVPHIVDPIQATTAQADPLTNLGEAAHIQGDLDRAAKHQADALAIYRTVNDAWGVVVTLQHLADIERDHGNIAPALERYSTCLGVAYEAGDDRVVAACLSGAGCIAAMCGQAVVATRLFAASETNLERAGIHVLLPTDRTAREHWLAECRKALDDGAFASEWSAGRALNREQIAETLASVRRPETADVGKFRSM